MNFTYFTAVRPPGPPVPSRSYGSLPIAEARRPPGAPSAHVLGGGRRARSALRHPALDLQVAHLAADVAHLVTVRAIGHLCSDGEGGGLRAREGEAHRTAWQRGGWPGWRCGGRRGLSRAQSAAAVPRPRARGGATRIAQGGGSPPLSSPG